jgi:hypothetical protein
MQSSSLTQAVFPVETAHAEAGLPVARCNVIAHEIDRVRSALWQILSCGLTLFCAAVALLVVMPDAIHAQAPATMTSMEGMSTSTDLFVMAGSDIDRPGLLPRVNYNIGIGHTFAFLKKDPIGDELTFSYMYENAGTHGFLHTQYGEHTESLGIMKNFPLPKTKAWSGYTMIQSGITSYTGNVHVQNRLDSGVSLGAMIHCSYHSSIWIQESYGKAVTVPWFTTASIGYTYSW